MSIPKVSLYQKLGKGAEGGHEFARIMNQLILLESQETGQDAIISSDESGDYKGVDAIVKKEWRYGAGRYVYTGIQYKFFPSNLSAVHRSRIKESLEKAIEKFPEMRNWILVTPEDFTKKDREWFERLSYGYCYEMNMIEAAEKMLEKDSKKKWRNELSIGHWGHSKIASLMLRHPEVGSVYYENSFPSNRFGKLSLSKISVDTVNTIWYKSSRTDNCFVQTTILDKNCDKSSELIFDFQFINNSANIHHLSQIHVIIENTWSQLKGLPSEEILKSIGTIAFDLDFTKKVNILDVDEKLGGPIIFKANESKRFKLQLNRFAKKCPGNMAEIRFEFHFDSEVIKSSLITLSF